jgi:hypothetical protein
MDDADELALALAERSIEQVSPQERAAVDALGPQLLEAGVTPGKDGALGFGVGEVALSVASIGAAKAAAEIVIQVLRGFAVDEGKSLLRQLIDRLRGRSSEPAPSVLGSAELARVRDAAYRHATAIGVDDARAATLADAITGSLATAAAVES